jgi:hypothetical protein
LLEFTLSHQRCVNAWIIAQYGLTRQEVEGVPKLDWLQTLLSRGFPLDVFAYIVEHKSIDKLLHLVKRRSAGEDELTVGTFQFEFAVGWVDRMLQDWDAAKWPGEARFLATLPNSFHVLRSDDDASQTRRYVFPNTYLKTEECEYVFAERSGEARPIVESIY